jgi:hypothetical protein
MPRSFSEYALWEWRRLRPFEERYKMARYWARTAWYVRRRPIAGETSSLASWIRGRRALITTAFNDPEAVAWQADFIRHHIASCCHVIIDNSNDDKAAGQIQLAARRRGLPYVRLPDNPWSAKEPSRSHGLAMGWTWHNVIRPGQPESFGFIDHDLFPLEETDPFAPLREAPVWGRILGFGGRWYLWAGFCFFRFDAVAHLNLDFRHDWYAGLDTGGRNWWPLYRHLDLRRIPTVSYRIETAQPDPTIPGCCFEWLGPWLHEGGAGQVREARKQKRDVLRRRLEALLATNTAAAKLGRQGQGARPPGHHGTEARRAEG